MATSNIASCFVAEKAGAYREGVLRNRRLPHARSHDAVMFSFTRSVPEGPNPAVLIKNDYLCNT